MYLTKELEGRGDCGPQFWEHPCFWGLWGKAQRGKREKTQGPVLDVGCIWVTELRKNSPAGEELGRCACGKGEILSLNGQLMVGVDVSGAR